MREHPILRAMTKLMFPFILMFGLYVIFHGEISPGGGFQGGVIVAAAFILYGLVFGPKRLRVVLPRGLSDALAAVGVLVYAGAGALGLLSGYRFLDYTPLRAADPGAAEALGMSVVEYGVALTVSMVMVTIFDAMTER